MEVLGQLVRRLGSKVNVLETGTIRSYHEGHESTRILGESV